MRRSDWLGRRGTTRSHLIREAIESRYGTAADGERIRRALKATGGLWKDRTESGTAYVERLRSGRRLTGGDIEEARKAG